MTRGGLTTKIHAAVDALGLPIRFELTSGQWADSPQAEGLIAGLEGVGHVIADPGYDTEPLRGFIAETLQAEVQIKRNRSRARRGPTDRGSTRSAILSSVSSTAPDASAECPARRENPRHLQGLRLHRLRNGLARLNEDDLWAP